MTLLAAAASGAGTTTTTTTTTAMPYEVPTSAPFNAPVYMTLPTPDDSNMVVHPSVHDFGPDNSWNGWRYWMAMTPFPLSDASKENPCILGSNDGWNWYVPAGLTNPIYDTPPSGRFNSDPHLEFDPLTSELVLLYREQQQDTTHQAFYARSADGVTWPVTATALNWTRPGSGIGQVLSPCLVRRGAGDWLVFGILKDSWNLLRWEATAPEGPWSGPFTCTGFVSAPWHMDVRWDGSKFVALVDNLSGESDGYMAGVSANGSAWTFTGPIMEPAPGEWDDELYRATFTPHENGTHYRVWYSAFGPASWRTGYTELPISLWPALP